MSATTLPPAPETTLAVILGASEFRAVQLANNPAFATSAANLRAYLLDTDNGFGLPPANLLWLFDADLEASALDEQLGEFLERRAEELVQAGSPPRDLLVYYVGHGGFGAGGESEYFLAIKRTRTGAEQFSSYTARGLANTLKNKARHLRKYVILDSCFSAAAYDSFQAQGPLDVAQIQAEDLLANRLPDKGTALLCATGPRNPALAPPGDPFTMFSGALVEVLRRGAPDGGEVLSLRVLADLTRQAIVAHHRDEAVRPQVHSPDQMKGDIADVGIFPNAARRPKQVLAQQAEELAQLKVRMAQVEQRLGTLNADFGRRLAAQEEAMRACEDRSAGNSGPPPLAPPPSDGTRALTDFQSADEYISRMSKGRWSSVGIWARAVADEYWIINFRSTILVFVSTFFGLGAVTVILMASVLPAYNSSTASSEMSRLGFDGGFAAFALVAYIGISVVWLGVLVAALYKHLVRDADRLAAPGAGNMPLPPGFIEKFVLPYHHFGNSEEKSAFEKGIKGRGTVVVLPGVRVYEVSFYWSIMVWLCSVIIVLGSLLLPTVRQSFLP
jgi:hypothetical protein